VDRSRTEDEASSGSTSADRELEAALDGFEAWARQEDRVGTPRLPPLLETPNDVPGSRLGDCELVRRLGAGGMGVVFEARQLSVGGRRVAVKVLRSVFATAASEERFRREVEAVATLDHPAIVPIADAHVDCEAPYYVMRFVEGTSAARLVRALRAAGEQRPSQATVRRMVLDLAGAGDRSSSASSNGWEGSHARWVASVGLQLAEALQYAHERGVVHRDVKPGNVMITRHGRAMLLDFGLAAVDGEHSLTGTGQFLGTLRYAAPEQVRGEKAGAPADVFALGVTLYELLALEHPLVQDSAEPRRRTGDEIARPLDGDWPVDLRTILLHALVVDPRRRYATAGALADDLRAFLEHRAIRARPPGVLLRTLRTAHRYPRALAFSAAALLTALGLLSWRERVAWRAAALGLEHLELGLAAQENAFELGRAHSASRHARPPDHRARTELRRQRLDQRRLAQGLLDQAEARLLAAAQEQMLFATARRGLARLDAARLRGALEASLDVLRPAEVDELEAALTEHDREHAFTDLIDPLGAVELRGAPGARVFVIDLLSPDVPVSEGPLPHEVDLPEGSYLARIDDQAGAVPFFVRRAAAEPGRRVVQMSVPEGSPTFDPGVLGELVHVPAGRVLVEREPAVWEEVEEFWMGRFEITEGQVTAWRRALEQLTEGLPLGLDFTPSADGASQMPARALTPMDMSGLLQLLPLVHPLPDGWTFDLPTRAEWIRAARGASAQAWPFGERFDWQRCVNYYSLSSFPGDAVPEVIGHNLADRSPFGIHDLAGSVAEVTRELHGPLPGALVVCGGSFRSLEAEELSIDHVDDVANEPRPDVGFRLVVRRLDPWFRRPDLPPQRFEDDFERPDDTQVGGDWLESLGIPGSLPTQVDTGEGARIAGGRLVCQGGCGHFSESVDVWHRVHLGDGDFQLRLRARSFLDEAWRETDQAHRQVSMALLSGPNAPTCQELALRVSGRGLTRLYWREAIEFRDLVGAAVPLGETLVYELLAHGDTIEARVLIPDQETPLATIRMERPAGFVPRYLVLRAPGLIGAGLEIEEILAEPLPASR
jgi:hypothetical protein